MLISLTSMSDSSCQLSKYSAILKGAIGVLIVKFHYLKGTNCKATDVPRLRNHRTIGGKSYPLERVSSWGGWKCGVVYSVGRESMYTNTTRVAGTMTVEDDSDKRKMETDHHYNHRLDVRFW